jgi:clan AA aspartic protease (TIGR02281 family)
MPTKTTLGLAVALTCLAAASAEARRVQVPVTGHGKALVVSGTINQRLSGHFLLDTGASYCVLGKGAAKEAGVQPDGRKVLLTTAHGVVQATVGTARRIDLGDAVARDVEVAVVDEPPLPGLEGILGLSFLQNFKYAIAADGRSILLEY